MTHSRAPAESDDTLHETVPEQKPTRIRHSTLPAGLILTKIGRHHLAFFKSWLEGLDMVAMGKRYLEPVDGNPVTEKSARDTIRWIRHNLATLARRKNQFAFARLITLNLANLPDAPDTPTLDEFREERDPDAFYSEAELLELFMAEYPGDTDNRTGRRNARLRQKQAAALSWLEMQANVDPDMNDQVEAWLVSNLARHLTAAGIGTIGDLVTLINTHGNRWYSQVPQLGEKSATRILRWLVSSEKALKVLIHAHALVKHSKLDVNRIAAARTKEFGIVPLEFFQQARPKFERKRAPEPVEMSRALPDDAMGYGLPVLEKMRAMKPPKEADQHKAPPPPKNYGADISTLIRMIEAGEL